jgi:hypothetical protein
MARSLFVIFLLFQGILPSYAYWDEMFFAGLILIWMALSVRRSGNKGFAVSKSFVKLALPWIGLVFTGLLGNGIFGYALYGQAIVRDIVAVLKFPFTFLLFREMGWDEKIAASLQKKGFRMLKAITVFVFVCGIISLFTDIGMSQTYEVRHGVYSYQFWFGHPTAMVTAGVMMTCLFCADEERENASVPIWMLLISILFCMRTKGFAFIAVFVFIRYGTKWLKKVKIFYWTGIFGVALVAGYAKLQLVASFSASAREVLWAGSFELLYKCFPIGSGLGTYASHISGKFVSAVYSFIWSNEFFSGGQPRAVLGDTGYPYYIGEFGLAGVVLLMVFAKRLLRIYKSKEKHYKGLAADSLLAYIAIALTAESVLLNVGYEMGVILAVVLAIDRMNEKYRMPVISKERQEGIDGWNQKIQRTFHAR